MNRTQFLDARRNIRRELVSFVSIVLIGMLASLSYLGITYSAATLQKDALTFFNTCELWDLDVFSTMLLDDGDLDAIRDLPGVERAEALWQADARLAVGRTETAVSVISVPETLSVPKLLEGRLPGETGECAIEQEVAKRCGLTVGQRIRLDSTPVSGIDPLAEKDYVITGVFQSPDHITYMIQTTPYILVTADSFNRAELEGAFMRIRVRVANAPENRYDEAYRQAVSPVEDAINAIAGERAEIRVERMRETLDNRIADGRRELEEAAALLADAEAQLEDGRRQLEEKRREFEDGRQQLEEARRQYEESPAKLAEARTQLDEAWAMLADAQRQLEEAKEQLDRGGDVLVEAEYQLAAIPELLVRVIWLIDVIEDAVGGFPLPRVVGSYVTQYKDSIRQFNEGRNLWYSKGEEYLDALTLYEKNRRQLELNEEDYAAAQAALADGEQQLLDGEAQLRDAEAALLDAQAQLEDAEQQLRDGRQQYRDGETALSEAEYLRDHLELGRWIVLNNNGNPGFFYARANVDTLLSLRLSFSTIFLVVGALVIYATIGRMVEEQRNLIGTVKAMGFYNREIFAKYLVFACSAALLGAALGVLIAWLPLQRTILNSYESLMNYGTGTRSFLFADTALVAGGSLAVSVVAVYLGCGRLLRQPAIRLMQKAMPESGRKKGSRSAEKSLYVRLIFRNMRTDWSRVLVTTVSIAGGCMLMVIGFTLRYGISGMPDRQFGGIQTYEAEVFFNSGKNPDAGAEIDAVLTENGLPHIGVYKAGMVFEADNTLNALTVIVADPGALEGYFTVRGLDGEALALPESGALVPRRFWEHYDFDVGDSVPVNLSELRLAGVYENYYGQMFLLTPAGYEECFLDAPGRNCFFVKTNGMGIKALQEKLDGIEGLSEVNDAYAERHMIEQFTGTLNLVVWLMLFIAGLMAGFIVTNFSMTYIQRKTGELTVMRINGFSTEECIRYAAVDLVVTTVLGVLLGLVLGRYMGDSVLMTTETPYIQMIREPNFRSFLYSALITFGFSAFSNSFALHRIRKLKLSDIAS